MQKSIQIHYDKLFKSKCEYAAEAGFHHVAVNLDNMGHKTENEWDRLTEDIGEILAKNGLECNQTHMHVYNLLESSEIPDDKSFFAIRQSIITSGKLGAKQSVYHPRSSFTTNFDTQASFDDNRAILSNLLDDAVNHGVSIAVENIPHFPDHPEWPFYTSNYRDLAALVDSFGDPHISVCWDFGHANLMDFDQCEALRFLDKRITCTHIHNNFTFYDDHASPDTGTVDWHRILPVLTEIGYKGALTLETHCRYADPELLRSFARHNFVCAEFLEGLVK